ncbi:MAG: DNA-3-methyladenine glycosylase I [Candidatus Methylacidiphilales bacterium]|nr:DNA-3-methyladenine glycosylase I [Candidatus Methylacidiphilales bacterium]
MPDVTDNKHRCGWCTKESIYIKYHDEEWGRPVHDDRVLFEFLILESFQAGLSWLTVLKKRENFRRAFSDYDAEKISRYDDAKVEELMQDAGIIRNRLKIVAAINNASCYLKIQKEFGSFDKYIWSFVNGKPLINDRPEMSGIPASTPVSDAMSKDMGKRGFKFRGTTICYAFMQAVGLVNDHVNSCWCKAA